MRIGFWIVAGAVVALDQWTKHLVQAALPPYESVPVLPGLLYLTHVHNTGVAFGLGRDAGPLLVIGAAVAAIGILLYWRRLNRGGEAAHPLLALGLALPLGGALGNLIDRVRLGHVVDFLDLRWWPIFNVADIAITAGAGALLLYFGWMKREAPEERLRERPCGGPAEAAAPTAGEGGE